jgi:hypothetical protein
MKDYTLGETIDFKFTTCEPDTGAPITFAGSPVISAYVDNSTTQITAGITLTVDFDGVTGLHNVRVVATSGNGYTTGTNVALIVTTGTVDSVSAVGYKVAEFSLGRAGTANVTQFDDTAGAVRWMQITDQGTAQAATGTTLQLRAAAAFADDELIGQTVFITGGSTGVGQSRLITDYVSATDTATVDTWTTTPTGTITYKICPTAPSSGGAGATAAEIADAVWDEATAGHTTSGTFGEQCKTDIDAILVDTGTTLDGAIADLPTNAELATALGTADDAVLTAIAGVQSDTNDIQTRLPAALNNGCIPADVQRINDTAVVGAGTEGDKWRA